MSTKILATADIHIGRRPSKVPDEEDARRFSSARIWEAIVDRAIAEEVDLVALAGDVVDHDNRFFEAAGPLERGLTRLARHNIHTYAVAGNHDHDVLRRIASSIGSEHFHLLGVGGVWEESIYAPDGVAKLKIHGWSFPAEHVETSPVAMYDLAADDLVPSVGLLHADLDTPQSVYAPVMSNELAGRPVALWLIGHVHRPGHLRTALPGGIISLGSPQAMDPGEPGRHGPWLIEIHGPNRLDAQQLAMSKVRYDRLTVDLSGVGTEEEFQLRVSETARDHLAAVAREEESLEYLSLRLELTGRTSLCSRIDELARPLVEQFQHSAAQVTAGVERVINATAPQIDLEELARKHDPPGVLAGTLLALESDRTDGELSELLKKAHQRAMEVHSAPSYGLISADAAPDVADVRLWLIRRGTLLLDRLLAQERST